MALRTRLLLGAGLIALVLAVATMAVVRSTRANLVDQIDGQLAAAGPQLSFGPDGPRGGPTVGSDGPRLSTLYVGVITRAGDLVTVFTPDLLGTDAPVPRLDDADLASLRAGRSTTVASSDAQTDYRMQVRAERGGALTVLALPLDDVDQATRRLTAVMGTSVLIVLGVMAVVVGWVVRLGVRPVQAMTATATAIAGGDLSRRVPPGERGTEAAELGAALNGMLERIEEAFEQRTASEERLRRFVADASHELRTPVATIRGYGELYRTGALRAPEALDDAMRRTEQEAVRMGSLVDDLLHLARLDQGRPLSRDPVDLAVLAEEAGRDAAAVEPNRTITVVAPAAAAVIGDEPRLRQVMANLLTNALVHAPGADIEVRVGAADGWVTVEVSDDGPGMDPADAERAFERFHRADVARSRHHGGSGLGLSIVEATVRAHGGTTDLEAHPGVGTTVRVRIPENLSRSAPPPTP